MRIAKMQLLLEQIQDPHLKDLLSRGGEAAAKASNEIRVRVREFDRQLHEECQLLTEIQDAFISIDYQEERVLSEERLESEKARLQELLAPLVEEARWKLDHALAFLEGEFVARMLSRSKNAFQ